jgi:hypothetical protein
MGMINGREVKVWTWVALNGMICLNVLKNYIYYIY